MKKNIFLLCIVLVTISNNLFSQNISKDLGVKDGTDYRAVWDNYYVGGTCVSGSTVLNIGYSTGIGDEYGGADWDFKLPNEITNTNQLEAINIEILGDRCDIAGSSTKLTFRKTNWEWLDDLINYSLSKDYEYNTFTIPSEYVDDCVMEWNGGLYLMPIISSEDNYNIKTIQITIEYTEPEPIFCFTTTVIDFGQIALGNNPEINTFDFEVENCGEGTLTGAIITSSNWLSVNPSSFSLSENQTKTIIATATTSNLDFGNYYSNISISTNDGGTSWNAAFVEIVEKPDIVVNSILVNGGNDIFVGDNVKIEATIQEVKNVDAGTVCYHYYIDNLHLNEEDNCSTISANNSVTVYFYYTFQQEGEHKIKVIVDPENDVDETNEGNNEKGITVTVKNNYSQPTISFIKVPNQNNVFNDVQLEWIGVDSDGTISGYEYKLDDDDITSTNSVSKLFQGLDNGNHTFEVRCIDNDGQYSDWISTQFEINVVLDIIVINEALEKPINGYYYMSELFSYSNSNYIISSVNEFNSGTLDLSNIETVIVPKNYLNELDKEKLGDKSVFIISDQYSTTSLISGMEYNGNNQTIYFSPDFSNSITEYYPPVAVSLDWQKVGRQFAETGVVEVVGFFTGEGTTFLSVTYYLSNGDIEKASVAVVGGVSGSICIATLPACATGLGCVVPITACTVKVITILYSIFDETVTINKTETIDNNYVHNLNEKRIKYPVDETINCQVYYEYDDELGYYVLKTDAPSICNYSNLNLSTEDGYFKFVGDGLSNSGNLLSNNDGFESFNEKSEFIINIDSKIQIDIEDNTFEYYESSTTTPDYSVSFQEADTFTNDLILDDGFLYPSDSTNESDFIINSEGFITTIEEINIESSINQISDINQEIIINTSISLEVGVSGLLQLMVKGKDGLMAVKYISIEANQSIIETIEVSFNDLISNPSKYNLYFQFRANTTSGPLETTEISDVINYIYDYEIVSTKIETIVNNDNVESIELFPNPFKDVLNGNYTTRKNCQLKINIYDINGKLIKILENKFHLKGKYSFKWDGLNNSARKVNCGMYIIQFITNDKITSKKVILK